MNDALRGALTTLGTAGHLLVGVDFDGTLAPFADEPMDATPVSGAMPALHALAHLDNVTVALVSGRALGDLHALTGADPSIVLIGSHGAESSQTNERDLNASEQASLAALDDGLRALVTEHPSARIERKPMSRVLHTRGLGSDLAHAATDAAVQLAGGLEGVTIKHGKDVVEIAVTDADKGTALLALAASVGADVIVYAGDDVTDEHAFEQLSGNDISVKVGPGETLARYRVSNEHSVVTMIEILRAVRAASSLPRQHNLRSRPCHNP